MTSDTVNSWPPAGDPRLQPLAYGRPFNADLYLFEPGDGQPAVVLKSFRDKRAGVKRTLGRFLARREYSILRHLRDITGVCRALRVTPGPTLELGWVDGVNIEDADPAGLPADFFERFTQVIRDMHGAGIVHLDLAHRGNVRVDTQGNPVLMDFQTAISTKLMPSFLVTFLRQIDEWAVLKWKGKLVPDALTEAERATVALRKRRSRIWPFRHWIFWPGSRRPKRKV